MELFLTTSPCFLRAFVIFFPCTPGSRCDYQHVHVVLVYITVMPACDLVWAFFLCLKLVQCVGLSCMTTMAHSPSYFTMVISKYTS